MASCSSSLSGSGSHVIVQLHLSSRHLTIFSVLTLASYFADVQHISNDAVRDLRGWLAPCDLQAAGGQSVGHETLGGSGQVFGMGHSQTSTGLVRACTVLRDALVDGFVVGADAGQRQRAADEGNDESRITSLFPQATELVGLFTSLLSLYLL